MPSETKQISILQLRIVIYIYDQSDQTLLLMALLEEGYTESLALK